jgi:hypothetical protein
MESRSLKALLKGADEISWLNRIGAEPLYKQAEQQFAALKGPSLKKFNEVFKSLILLFGELQSDFAAAFLDSRLEGALPSLSTRSICWHSAGGKEGLEV